MTTSRADNATSNTTLAANPAGNHGASSPPLTSNHQSPKNKPSAIAIAEIKYARLEGIRLRECARECDRELRSKN